MNYYNDNDPFAAQWLRNLIELGNPDLTGRQTRGNIGIGERQRSGESEDSGAWGDGLEHTNSQRQQEQCGAESMGKRHKSLERPSGNGFWSDSILIPCADGKQRRIPIEPAFFPLAPGLPGRVGLLKGAGNSIVPQVAAEFVAAFMETERG